MTAITASSDRRVTVKSTEGLKVGDRVRVDHPGSQEWIHAVGMDSFPSRDLKSSWLDWKPGMIHLTWHRTIDSIDGRALTLDAPLPYRLDPALAPVTVAIDERFTPEGAHPIQHCGVENLTIDSTFDEANPRDEEHAWDGIRMDQVEDAWVRNVRFRHLSGSAVALWEQARRITVTDCDSRDPVSEEGAARRHTFFTAGEQTLFQRCQADSGRHDFSVGHFAPGPNAFVVCRASNARAFSGAIGSWACGILFDSVEIDGAGLALTNLETSAQGTGWAAVNSVMWNCVAPLVTCRMPPTAHNWGMGIWGEVVGDGHWRQLNEFVSPSSLYQQQLRERIGQQAADQIVSASGESAPARALEVAVEANRPERLPQKHRVPPLQLRNGWLTFGDRLATGGRFDPTWWRGSILPTRASEFGPCLTRFVPGREGIGFTDPIDELIALMKSRNQSVLGHHWGLWYDRRRDDHQMVRRMDGNVWPPFYEQPWARTGQGTAWDGLSRYDLTKFNPWYFGRLKSFADQADQQGLVLVSQMYFQHNILEAGAHWADFPWRPANCVNDTGFPEPPVYENRKRVFMADTFYDISHPIRRQLHRAYVRHSLDVLGSNSNVLFLIGEEFTGPAAFVRFWLESIGEWQQEQGRDVLVGISCTKDVQDEMLNDPALSSLIDVIDLKYWWYTAEGPIYAPPGGANLAPRQQLREWQGSTRRSDSEVARAISEYRIRYPEKAVICSLSGANPWIVAAAGGSLPALPQTASDEFLQAIPAMTPTHPGPDGASRLELAGRQRSLKLEAAKTSRREEPGAAPQGLVTIQGSTGQVQGQDNRASGPRETQGPIHYRVVDW